MPQSNTYAIGDIQGCHESLVELLDQLPENAKLIFVGDIVNRGPGSLASLRLVRDLVRAGRAQTILGNHDIYLLWLAATSNQPKSKDTLQDILTAPDAIELIDFLRTRPLMIEHAGFVFAHAGVPPFWNLSQARFYAGYAHRWLSGDQWKWAVSQIFGNEVRDNPSDPLARLRFIMNCYTRMRYMIPRAHNLMEFKAKLNPTETKNLIAWFEMPRRIQKPICFGHWSTLGLVNRPKTLAIDTGCVWGGAMTAVRLSDRRIYTQICPQYAPIGC